jgi:ClpP class serine protease
LVAILEGKPFTPAEALATGAVDELVPQDRVVARATELAEYFGSRPKGAQTPSVSCPSAISDARLEERSIAHRPSLVTPLPADECPSDPVDRVTSEDESVHTDGELGETATPWGVVTTSGA